MHMLSLKKIGAQSGGVTKERVRQIIKQAQENLQKNVSSLSVFLDHFEEKSGILQKKLENGPLDLGNLVQHLLSDPVKPELVIEEREVTRLIILIRSLVLSKRPWFWEEMEPRWRTFILLSSLVTPPLRNHKQVRQTFEEMKPEKKKNGYKDLIHAVLVKAGKPMHWSSIAEQASQLGERDRFSSKTILSSLQYYKELFVRVGKGTYGLVEWGGRTPAPYNKVIASILREEGRPMSKEQIFARVSVVRPASLSSVSISLGVHYRFYKSIENTYGLRAWLYAAEGQSDPRPIWLIEDPKSCPRVERARARGYGVDQVIVGDRLWQPGKVGQRSGG
jgi:hypothetical protein